jgi:ABC-2 type transport system permease protein
MWLIGLALIPMATVSLAISQKVNSPLLVMLVALFVIQLVSKSLLGAHGVGHFIEAISVLPFELLTAENPLSAFANMGMVNLLIYVLLGALGLVISLRFAKYAD